MKLLRPSTILSIIILVFFISCINETGIEPADLKITETELAASQTNNANDPKIVLYLELEKGKTKIEVNQNQATLNFDNHEPRIVRIISKEKMLNLKNFRAENNLLKEVPELALYDGIKRIEVPYNRITKLPRFKKVKTLKLLDLSYNKMKVTIDELRKLALPPGATLNLTKTGIPCKYICDYIKRNPNVTVISDCGDCTKKIVEPIPIIKK